MITSSQNPDPLECGHTFHVIQRAQINFCPSCRHGISEQRIRAMIPSSTDPNWESERDLPQIPAPATDADQEEEAAHQPSAAPSGETHPCSLCLEDPRVEPTALDCMCVFCLLCIQRYLSINPQYDGNGNIICPLRHPLNMGAVMEIADRRMDAQVDPRVLEGPPPPRVTPSWARHSIAGWGDSDSDAEQEEPVNSGSPANGWQLPPPRLVDIPPRPVDTEEVEGDSPPRQIEGLPPRFYAEQGRHPQMSRYSYGHVRGCPACGGPSDWAGCETCSQGDHAQMCDFVHQDGTQCDGVVEDEDCWCDGGPRGSRNRRHIVRPRCFYADSEDYYCRWEPRDGVDNHDSSCPAHQLPARYWSMARDARMSNIRYFGWYTLGDISTCGVCGLDRDWLGCSGSANEEGGERPCQAENRYFPVCTRCDTGILAYRDTEICTNVNCSSRQSTEHSDEQDSGGPVNLKHLITRLKQPHPKRAGTGQSSKAMGSPAQSALAH